MNNPYDLREVAKIHRDIEAKKNKPCTCSGCEERKRQIKWEGRTKPYDLSTVCNKKR